MAEDEKGRTVLTDEDLGQVRNEVREMLEQRGSIVEFARLEPKPGEVFILRVDAVLSEAQAEAIRAAWKRAMGDWPVIVLDGSVTLEVAVPPA